MMTVETFRESLGQSAPPADLPPVLLALWWAGRGDWDRAHDVVQGHEGEADCDVIHAHLHRQEGDMMNARYWYRRAGRDVPVMSVADEWTALAAEMLRR
jgi:hypothetical protein